MLASWDARDLAQRVGMSRVSIEKTERGDSRPRQETVDKIVQAFSEVGIEFIGTRGVTKRDEAIQTVTGPDAWLRILTEICLDLKDKPGAEALFSFVDNSKSPPEVRDAHRRIREAGVKCRYLCRENPEYLDFPAEDYRAVPERHFWNNVQATWANKTAQAVDTTATNFVILTHPSMSEAARRAFAFMWDNLPCPKPSSS